MDEDSDEPDEAERTEEPILSIFVQTLGEDIGRPDIVDNIKVRITYHSTIVSSFMHDNEWFVRLNSAQQANRVCGRLNHCWILKHTILIRCGCVLNKTNETNPKVASLPGNCTITQHHMFLEASLKLIQEIPIFISLP